MKNFSLLDNRFILGALLVLAALVVYLPSAQNAFVWDDYFLIVNNPLVRDTASIPVLFSQDLGGGVGQTYNFFRPLQIALYTLAYQVFGLEPAGYRLINIATHALVTLALYYVLLTLFGRSPGAFWAALLFAVHPVNAEAVLYISCLADCLSTLFMLTAFIVYIKLLERPPNRRSVVLFTGFLLSALASLLAKELGMILPILLVLYHWIFRKKVRRSLLVSLALVFMVYLTARFFSVSMLDPKGFSVPLLLRRIPGFFVAVFQYTRLFVFPVGLHMDYGVHFFRWMDARVIAGILFCVGIIWYLVRELRERRLTAPVFGVALYGVGLVAHSNLIFYLNQSYMMEHWFYLSALGLSCAVSYWIWRFLSPRASAVFCSCLVLCFGLLTVRQTVFWKDEAAVYERSLSFSPRNFRVLANLCALYREEGDCDRALEVCTRALEIIPDSPVVLSNLANVFFCKGEKDKAVKILEDLVRQGTASRSMEKNLDYMRRHMEDGPK
jgi:protein O-mannosyl-transferase